MMSLWKDASKVALYSLIATFIVFATFWAFFMFANFNSEFVIIGNVFITFCLFFLLINPIVGLIYSFFVKGNKKWIFITVHLIVICTISALAFFSIMFRFFIPFAP